MIKKGFTLAEIMIVLAVIGVLTAVLLPVAINSSPNEDIMKFKKGHNALLSTIRELVNSDKYYLDGDLGIKADGTVIDGTHDGDVTYFCNTLADTLNTKNVNCSENKICKNNYCWNHLGTISGIAYLDVEKLKKTADEACLNSEEIIGAEITTSTDTIFYQVSPIFTFGIAGNKADLANMSYEEVEISDELLEWNDRYNTQRKALLKNDDGLIATYKFICMDIDGIGKGEDPFGYGIRADGKVLPGARADEWLQKSIQEKE